MQEVLLHYLWRYQKFSSPSLVTTEGKEISIDRPGNPNAGGGPDFLEAQIFLLLCCGMVLLRCIVKPLTGIDTITI